jgi:phospholipid/cholesterol/gamma-HCH transport system substrate-binding protein
MLALVLVVFVGVYYIVVDVMRYRIGSQGYTVSTVLPTAGGLYPGADVTYRGVDIGDVTSLNINPSGVVVKMVINPGVRVPNNGIAVIKDLSALGEQYLDFQPDHGGGPYLHSGSVIAASRVVLPTPIGTTLLDLGSLLNSVNANDLQTVEQFFYTAFDGTGRSLTSIIDNGQDLFQDLNAAAPETTNLVLDGHTDLQTLKSTDADLTTFASGLAQLTNQLKASNSDIEALINNGASATSQLNQFLSSYQPSLQNLITSLSTDAQASYMYQPSVQALFQLLPVVAGKLAGTASNGQISGEVAFNTANTLCAYVSSSTPLTAIPVPTQTESTPQLSNYCPNRASDLLQRGAYNAPGGS